MALKRRTQAENTENIRRLASQPGWYAQRIADKLKLSRSTVYGYAWKAGIEIERAPNAHHDRGRKTTEALIEFARLNPGVTRTAMALKFGLCSSTVHRTLRAAGVPTRRQYDADGKLIDQPVKTA